MKRTALWLAASFLAVTAVPAASLAVNSIVQIETNYGIITLELYDDDAPVTVANFLEYVNSGFYDGLIFHRVIEDFVIQAGAYDDNLYDPNISGGDPNYYDDPNWPQDPYFYHQPNDSIINESDNGLSNTRGTIAMARRSDPNSANSQFFINHADNSDDLDRDEAPDGFGYCVFGAVTAGMNVVDAISAVDTFTLGEVGTDPNNDFRFRDVPEEPVIIERILQYNSLTLEKVTIKAGKNRQQDPNSDYFFAQGTFPTEPNTIQAEPNDLYEAEEIIVRLLLPRDGTLLFEEAIELTPGAIEESGKPYYFYKNRKTVIQKLKIDLNKRTFLVQINGLDLGGLKDSVILQLEFGNFLAMAGADEAIINGRKPVPNQLAQGYIDALQVHTYRFASSYPYTTSDNSLLIVGALATEVDPLVLEGKEITIKWGTNSFTIPEGVSGLNQKGNKPIYIYKKSTNSGLVRADFNLETGLFVLKFRHTTISKPTQNLNIVFEADTDIDFNETVSVAAP